MIGICLRLMKRFHVGLLVGIALPLIIASSFTGKAEATGKKIKIGIVGPMKFTRGEMVWLGSKLAADEINAAGGVNIGGEKYDIELIKADTNEYLSIPDAVSTMEKLVTVDKVNFVVGGCRTEAVLAQQEVLADNKVIMINAIGIAHPEVTVRVAKDYDRYKYWFRLHPSSADGAGKVIMSNALMAAMKIREQLGIQKPRIALLMERAKWVDPIVAMAQKFLPKMGMEVVGVWRPSSMATDVAAELTAIKAAGAHVIFDIFSGPVGVTSSRQWGELKIPAALAGFNTSAQRKEQWKETGGFCNYETTFHSIARVEMSPKTIPFFDNFEAKYNKWPEQDAGNYDVIYFLKEAVERAGSLDPDLVVAELEKLELPVTYGPRVVFYPKEEWTKTPRKAHSAMWAPGYITFLGVQWRDGKLLTVWPEGKPVLGDKSWIGVRYKGTVDYELPPWVVKYWKGKNQ